MRPARNHAPRMTAVNSNNHLPQPLTSQHRTLPEASAVHHAMYRNQTLNQGKASQRLCVRIVVSGFNNITKREAPLTAFFASRQSPWDRFSALMPA
jgi:hypothetical protein